MAYTEHQLEYWQPICHNCVLYVSVSQCHRLADMSKKADRYYAKCGCLLAFARIHKIEPAKVSDAVKVTRDEDDNIVLRLAG